MAFVKIDRSQTRTALALVIVLAATVVFTLMRLSPSQQPQPAAEAASAEPQSREAAVAQAAGYDAARDPFKKPELLATASTNSEESASAESDATASLNGLAANRWENPYRSVVGPMRVPWIPAVDPPPKTEDPKNKASQTAPTFTLLATVKSSGGYCAVIRTDGSKVSVVDVGDILEGGFWVKRLGGSHAVLTDGRDTIIARRPRN